MMRWKRVVSLLLACMQLCLCRLRRLKRRNTRHAVPAERKAQYTHFRGSGASQNGKPRSRNTPSRKPWRCADAFSSKSSLAAHDLGR